YPDSRCVYARPVQWLIGLYVLLSNMSVGKRRALKRLVSTLNSQFSCLHPTDGPQVTPPQVPARNPSASRGFAAFPLLLCLSCADPSRHTINLCAFRAFWVFRLRHGLLGFLHACLRLTACPVCERRTQTRLVLPALEKSSKELIGSFMGLPNRGHFGLSTEVSVLDLCNELNGLRFSHRGRHSRDDHRGSH